MPIAAAARGPARPSELSYPAVPSAASSRWRPDSPTRPVPASQQTIYPSPESCKSDNSRPVESERSRSAQRTASGSRETRAVANKGKPSNGQITQTTRGRWTIRFQSTPTLFRTAMRAPCRVGCAALHPPTTALGGSRPAAMRSADIFHSPQTDPYSLKTAVTKRMHLRCRCITIAILSISRDPVKHLGPDSPFFSNS